MPPELRAAHSEIEQHLARKEFAAAGAKLGRLVGELTRFWGEYDPDLIPYWYNLALTARQARRSPDALRLAEQALERWPQALQLLVLAGTVRAETASARGHFDEQAERHLASVLRPEALPGLRGYRVQPGELFSLRAQMHLQAGRTDSALELATQGLLVEPESLRCLELRGAALLALRRAQDALPVLLEAEKRDPAPELQAQLARCEREGGDAARAWRRLAPLLQTLATHPAGSSGAPPAVFDVVLRESVRTLAALGHDNEVVAQGLKWLLREPSNLELLQHLSRSFRGLGRAEASAAAEARTRRLLPGAQLQTTSLAARAEGLEASYHLYQARRLLLIDRTGAALELLETALTLAPGLEELRVERAELLAVLGEAALAERELAAANLKRASPLLLLELARLSAIRGAHEEALRFLKRASETPVPPRADAPSSTAHRSMISALEARVHLELGDFNRALESVAGTDPTMPPEDLPLIRSEALLRRGDLQSSRAALQASSSTSPGARGWAGALRAVLGALEDPPAELSADPSDFLENPRLLPVLASATAARPPQGLLRIKDAVDRVRVHRQGSSGLPPEKELVERLELLVRLGARRKARELGWRAAPGYPSHSSVQRAFTRALGAPEDLLDRFEVVESALRSLPGDPGLVEVAAEARKQLGAAP